MTDVTIIDYGSGNLRSVVKAFEHATNANVTMSSDPNALRSAEAIVLPGVGAFGDCMKGLSAIDGMLECLQEQVIEKGKPFLGICVGMQLLAHYGLEHGKTEGLGWFEEAVVEPIPSTSPEIKLPHMGWNVLSIEQSHPVMEGINTGDHIYFVHSYHMAKLEKEHVIATSDYGITINAVVGRDNIIATQFHPEKSQKAGLQLVENFVNWRP